MVESSEKAEEDLKEFETRHIKVSKILLFFGFLKVFTERDFGLPEFLLIPVIYLADNPPMEIIGFLALILSPAFAFSGLSYSRGFYKKEKRLPHAIFFISLGLMVPTIFFVMELLSIR